jgi:hypothetical protein
MKTLEKFFVMLRYQNQSGVAPLVGETGEVALFNSRSLAEQAAIENPMGFAFGYEVFPVELER